MTQNTGAVPDGVESVICPMCVASSHTLWMTDGKPTCYVRCRQCRTVYASPRAPYARRYAWLDASFGVGEGAYSNALGRRPALALEAQVIKEFVTGGRLLDIGCDLGDFFVHFPSPAWERCGVELSPSAASYASAHYDADVHAGTLQQAGFRDESFDVVSMIDVIYYLDDPASEYREIRRVLKDGGLLAIEVTGQAYQLARSRGILCWLIERRWTRLRTDSAYLFWPTPSAVLSFLQRLGFAVIDQRVIPSPQQRNPVTQVISDLHTGLMTAVVPRWSQTLTLAPKYLILARRMS